jgi:hypothetical protein
MEGEHERRAAFSADDGAEASIAANHIRSGCRDRSRSGRTRASEQTPQAAAGCALLALAPTGLDLVENPLHVLARCAAFLVDAAHAFPVLRRQLLHCRRLQAV